MTLLLGAIADDATGATDLASILVSRGMRTVQIIGVPRAELDVGDAEAVVVALKSRTAPVDAAVHASLEALAWLRRKGAKQIFFKYCSTFDSTPKGNIGPVADALMDAVDGAVAVVCPAFPANERTVYQGHLFVGRELLSESSMKDHPLTPMTDANLVRVMGAQSRRRVGLVAHETVAAGSDAVTAALAALAEAGVSWAVTDAVTDADLETIGRAAADHALVTGGSGVALGLPENFRARGLLGAPAAPPVPAIEGPAAVLAGSCSAATRGQLDAVEERWPYRRLDVERLMTGGDEAADALTWARARLGETPVVITAAEAPAAVRAIQERFGREEAGAAVETAFAHLARGLVDAGVRRLVVAGGETAGAVVTALGVEALRIGATIAPGVPWTETVATPGGPPPLALALKSGNFGGPDFFTDAFRLLEERP